MKTNLLTVIALVAALSLAAPGCFHFSDADSDENDEVTILNYGAVYRIYKPITAYVLIETAPGIWRRSASKVVIPSGFFVGSGQESSDTNTISTVDSSAK
jgi:DNA-binding response OmpR family regulator